MEHGLNTERESVGIRVPSVVHPTLCKKNSSGNQTSGVASRAGGFPVGLSRGDALRAGTARAPAVAPHGPRSRKKLHAVEAGRTTVCRPFDRVGLCDTGIQRPAGASQLSRMNSGAGAGQLTDTVSAAAATRRLGVA